MTPKNPKRKAYRDPAHPFNFYYLKHGNRMHSRKAKRANARATVRYYHVSGEAGGNRYELRGGEIKKHAAKPRPSKMAVMGMIRAAIAAGAKTGIQRQQ